MKGIVYVDRLFKTESRESQAYRVGRRNGHWWCHMWSDDLDALHAMAKRIGLKREWFQDRREFPHYDLTPSRRRKAMQFGAVECNLGDWIRRKRKELELGI